MQFVIRSYATLLVFLLLCGPPAVAQSFTPSQRGEIEQIVREYLLGHPELLQEVISEMDKRQATADAEKHRAAINEHQELIFNSPRQVTIGNPQGDVTLVEFFDYNCGYCKRALTDLVDLMNSDSRLKV